VRSVFVDTSGFAGLLVAEDASHRRAVELFEQARSEHWALLTTNGVVMECYSLLLVRARDGRRSAIRFLDALEHDQVRVERIRGADEQRAAALLRAHQDKDYSLCDAISFLVMERLDIAEAIAFDRHFREYGKFRIL
jgi:predicted nucleic acid-binding protein